ncbi:MAG: carbamoyltransferase HypF [Proteobacteria bacterium]|nr:carbamoyltransferase HypF [Pseudomonadota bacterium]
MNKLENIKRVRIKVSGIVQGVGFRPTTYRYAHDFNLVGHVVNTPEGVTIEAQGPEKDINGFIKKLLENPPSLAKITGFNIENIEPEQNNDFVILTSYSHGYKETEISPDIATCDDCISDIFDRTNRRYLYPFTNCTNCGPRFSIIKDRPYDRKKTSMSIFTMCPDCQKEYNNPNDRRFHAQPNACPKCGPSIRLLNLKESFDDAKKIISQTVKLIKNGAIISIKSIGGFNIACDPYNKAAVNRLRIKKNRPAKAFAMMAKDMATVEKICYVSNKEREILTSRTAPIVLLRKKDNSFDHISPDNNYLGIVLPFTPLHHILFEHIDLLIMTSANKTDEPIAINDEQIFDLMKDEIVDYSLTHNRDIVNRCDDSIVQIVNNEVQVIRRARGMVPTAFNIGNTVWGDNLSMGANLKNTFSIKKNNKIYMSQHIGDLSDVRNYDYQKGEITKFLKLLDFKTDKINIDAHPGYENYNENYNKIYHHHAHALSAMAENGLLGKSVLGIICDGTGYGTDGNIWGFEFLDINKDYRKFKRSMHLKYFPLPGGEKAIDEIDRIAISISKDIKETGRIVGSKFISQERQTLINGIIDKGINCPLVSSLGRLFDGVAALCGIIQKVSYEAQAAILLQKQAENFLNNSKDKISRYNVSIDKDILDYEPMIRELIVDVNAEESIEKVAYKFHMWVVDAILAIIKKEEPAHIVFSGGCFQNSLLCKLLNEEMKKSGMKYFFNYEIPINDAGVSFGQSIL